MEKALKVSSEAIGEPAIYLVNHRKRIIETIGGYAHV